METHTISGVGVTVEKITEGVTNFQIVITNLADIHIAAVGVSPIACLVRLLDVCPGNIGVRPMLYGYIILIISLFRLEQIN